MSREYLKSWYIVKGADKEATTIPNSWSCRELWSWTCVALCVESTSWVKSLHCSFWRWERIVMELDVHNRLKMITIICFHQAVTFTYFFSLQAWTRLNSCRAMRIKRFIRRPLIWLSTTLEQRMKTAALPHRWISASNSTSSSSVRLPWKASSSEVPLCCVLLYLASPVVEPQATRGVILSMFSITLFALIRLPCAHALTYVWKTFGSSWQDAPSLARGHQNHPSPLDSEPLHCHLRGAKAPFYTLRYSLLLLQENNPSSTSPHTPGIQDKVAFLTDLLQCVPAVQGDIQTFWGRSWINSPYSALDASLDGWEMH